MKIIAVDDVKQNRYLLQKLLEGHGYSVETASNGVEALEKARASTPPRPDMIITDVLMPRMDGFQLCRELKADKELKDVPVLFYSATYTDKKSQELAMSIGAAGYIVKPIEPDEFIKIIRATLEKYERGELKPVEKPLEESEYVKLHSERLIQKLEKKMLDMEREITERKRAEEKLAKIVDGVNIPAFAINSEHKITHWNTAVESLTGVKRETAVGSDKQWIALYAKKRPVMADLIVDEAPESKFKDLYGDKYQKSSLIEGAYEAVDFFPALGEEGKWLLFTAAPLSGSEGTVIGAIETIQDITERRHAEEALRASEEKYHNLVERANDGITIIQDNIVKYLNSRLAEMWGSTDEELIGTPFTDYIHPDEIPKVVDRYKRRMRGEDIMPSYELVFRRKDGSDMYVEVNASKITYQGNPADLVIVRDITKRKRMESELKKEKAFTESALNILPDMFYVFDIEGRFLRWNKTANAVTGYSDEEISSMKPTDFFSEDDKERVVEAIGISVQERHTSVEATLITKDGRHIPYEFRGALLKDPEGNAIGISGVGRDLTDRKHAEEALRASDKEHQIILDSVPVSIFHTDTNSRFVHVNEVLAKRYGMKPEDFKGKTSKELFPDEGEKYIKSDKEVLESGEPQIGVTKKIKTPQGLRWVRLDKVPVKDADGNVTGIIGFELDITKRIEAQEELRAALKELQDVIEFLPDATFVIDRDKKVIAWNRAIEEMTGLQKEDIIGVGDYAYAVPFYGLRRPILIDLVSLSDKEIESRYEYVKRKGHTLFAEVFISSMYGGKGAHLWGTATPLLDSEGNIIGAIESIRDITERTRAEEALRVSEEEYRSLVESTEDSVYLVDRDCRYLFINDNHLSRIGLPVDKIIGKTYGELHSEDETAEFAGILEEVFETGKSVQHEHRSRRDNRYILRTLSPVKDAKGRVTAVTVVSKDITDRKRVEEEREILLKELEAKNTELERFTYTVSHDLRSPLITIQGFTDMVQTDLEQHELGKAKDNLTFIDKAATKMDKLLSDTLQLSRIGRIANPPEDVPFGAIVEDALEQTAAQIKSSGVEVSVAEDFPTVHVDRMRIAEVLVNLIGNSIRYMGDQPHPKIEIRHRVDGKETVFFVKDNGIGMDESQHDKVFELFYRVDTSGEGTGAGLAIVKRIIEVHGGRIWIESEMGKGCTICFTLPVT